MPTIPLIANPNGGGSGGAPDLEPPQMLLIGVGRVLWWATMLDGLRRGVMLLARRPWREVSARG